MNKNKTLKKTTAFAENMASTTNEPSEYVATESTYRDFKMPMMSGADEDTQDVRQQRITELVQQMNSRQVDNGGHNLADFKPLDHPMVNVKKPEIISGDAPTYLPTVNPLYNQAPPSYQTSKPSSVFSASNSDQYPKNDYHQVYQAPPPLASSSSSSYYYGNGGGVNAIGNDPKLLDKINYMIHLLEDQKNEKTNHTLEEFVMFTLVGVFIIYVLDSFSRSGRYVR